MKQSRLMSFVESVGNTLSGFLLSLLAQWLFLPFIGVQIDFHQNLIFAVFMTFVSVVRSFGWRRLMEALHIRHPISPFMAAVIAERQRQQDVEGWNAAHDDGHESGELAVAGACYALHAGRTPIYTAVNPRPLEAWPWDRSWWKPTGIRRDLVKAGALIAAEGERFDRSRKSHRRKPDNSETDGRLPPRVALVNHLKGDDSRLAHGKTNRTHAGTSE